MAEIQKSRISVRPFLHYLLVALIVVGAIYGLSRIRPFYSFAGIAIPQEYQDIAGHWSGGDLDLSVPKYGNVKYKRKKGGYDIDLDMPLQAIAADKMTVGIAFWTTEFAIQVPPHKVGDAWLMTLEGTELTRKD